MPYRWPYKDETGITLMEKADVLVLGGGLAGCYAAIAAARAGKKVILMEKGATVRSGSAGSGFDHWENAATNPGSRVTAKELAEAYVQEQEPYSNGIAHYIECREGWDRLLDMESFGGKIRDTEDEFAGAAFRDEETKLLYAYDYTNRFTLRVWGSTFKPALYRELKRLGVTVLDRTEATALLMDSREENKAAESKKKPGSAVAQADSRRCTGAIGMNTRTGKLVAVSAGATVLAMSRPARIWLFNADLTGLCEFRPMQSIGSGHAMGWRAGVEFTMMEKSVPGEFSAAGRSFPPYGTGNNHNTWYAATMVDARGVELPYVDRDGRELKTVDERYRPAPGQKFFLKGGVIDEPRYEYRGPETISFETAIQRGYQLPFYADLSRMPDTERRAIWGLMVGEEGKTKIPILQNYTERGFDPEKHMLQSYGTGWKSAAFLPQERQLFGAPGGIVNDWDLKTNIDGLYAAGDQLFASDCAGFAAATGYYAGRKAAASLQAGQEVPDPDQAQVEAERERLYAPLRRSKEDGRSWKELNFAVSKLMQNYCGGVKNESLLTQGLDLLESYRRDFVPLLSCDNPHDLMRIHEVLDIMDVCELILESCRARKSSSAPLCFERTDYPQMDPPEDRRFITIRKEGGKVLTGSLPADYFGDLETEYERHNGGTENLQDLPEETKKRDESAGREELSDAQKKAPAFLTGKQESRSSQFVFDIVPCSARPLVFDPEKCIGCGRCAEVCQVDVLVPSEKKGEHPVIAWPGECYYCGSCVMECPVPGALKLQHPLMNVAKFVPVIPKKQE